MNNSIAETRFWPRIQKTATCWLWTGAKAAGYGQMCLADRRRVKVHRFSYELVHGPISPDIKVCHSCDTPLCVNPDHLFLGTQGDNVADMIAKGRARGAQAVFSSRTTCGRGHPYAPGSFTLYRGRKCTERKCLVCRRESYAARRAR